MSSRPICPDCGEYATLSGCEGGVGGVCKYKQAVPKKTTKKD